MSSFQTTIKTALSTSLRAQQQILKPNKLLDDAISNAAAQGIPPIAVAPSQGQLLSILCQLSQAKSVLEIGTLGGYSTIWLAQSVSDVHVTSIEFDRRHRDVATENTKSLKNVDIHFGAALDILPKLAEEGKVFDFVFIDADWDQQKEYFDWSVKLTRKGGCIYVDNVVRQLTESDAEGDATGWALIERVQSDERVEATLIPTLSTHKAADDELVDGFIMAIVKWGQPECSLP